VEGAGAVVQLPEVEPAAAAAPVLVLQEAVRVHATAAWTALTLDE
jgi:hypothetical protein